LTVAGHRQGDYLLLEFERAQSHSPSWWNHAARAVFLDALSDVRSIAQCVKLLVDTVFTNSGLDRVMCYSMFHFFPRLRFVRYNRRARVEELPCLRMRCHLLWTMLKSFPRSCARKADR
jgi:hypothetical protein